MEKGYIFGKQEKFIMGNGKMEIEKDQVFVIMLMEINIQDNFKMISSKDKELISF